MLGIRFYTGPICIHPDFRGLKKNNRIDAKTDGTPACQPTGAVFPILRF
jgi:hypothetical protein